MANFKPLTRYTGGTATKNRSDKDFLILRRALNLEAADGDIFITVTQEMENRPDLLSYYAYDTPELWWIIYEFNNIRDPLFELTAGATLRVPQLDRVINAINELEEDN